MNRRTFFLWTTRGIGALVALGIGVPVLLLGISPTLRRRPAHAWQQVGPVDAFPVGDVVRAQVQNPPADWAAASAVKGVYVWRSSANDVVVYARNCTDLSCPVNWDPGSRVFVCPCHGGVFAIDGSRMAGPPPRPLFRFNHRVQGGVLEIDIHSLPPMT